MLLEDVINRSKNALSQLREIYKTNRNKQQLFVTFTIHEKFGINPKSSFNTPIGIYAYPLKYVIDVDMDVPYAKTCPYIWVFQAKDFLNLQSSFNSKIKNRIIDDLDDRQIDIDDTLEMSSSNIDTYIGLKKSLILHTSNDKNNPNVIFRTILVSSGVNGILDDGSGTIHKNEPTQAAFFDVTKLKIISLITQPTYVHDEIPNVSLTTEKVKFEDYYDGVVNRNFRRDIDVERSVIFAQPPTENQILKFISANVKQRGGRLQFLEKFIAYYPVASLKYARDVLLRRFVRGEKKMKLDPSTWSLYNKIFPETSYK